MLKLIFLLDLGMSNMLIEILLTLLKNVRGEWNAVLIFLGAHVSTVAHTTS